MDGVHDLGGREGHGPVQPEADEPTFHARWEAAVFAMQRALAVAGVTGNTDRFRHAVERIDPAAYLTHGYYGRWLGGLETLAVEAGLTTQEALDAAVAARGGDPAASRAARPAEPPDVVPAGSRGASVRPGAASPRFAAGDRVRTRRHGVPGHTRLPAYARGCMGTITAVHDAWVYPDTHAHGVGECPKPLYTLAFDGTELWGPNAEPGLRVHLDLFEPYLDPADG